MGWFVGAPAWILLPALLTSAVFAVSWNGLACTIVAELDGRDRSGTALGPYNTVMGPGAMFATPASAPVLSWRSSY